jgi:hypothetical protein
VQDKLPFGGASLLLRLHFYMRIDALSSPLSIQLKRT